MAEELQNRNKTIDESDNSLKEKNYAEWHEKFGWLNEYDFLYYLICKIYFPHWKPWPYKYIHELKGGYCNSKLKILFFGDVSPEDLPYLIVHEICHAVTTVKHGKKMVEQNDISG